MVLSLTGKETYLENRIGRLINGKIYKVHVIAQHLVNKVNVGFVFYFEYFLQIIEHW